MRFELQALGQALALVRLGEQAVKHDGMVCDVG
jgi:hypothetical protein